MKNLILFFCFLSVILNSFSQNLIINPGFEEYTKCPRDKLNNHLESHGVKGWRFAGDYWNTCGQYYKEPHSGNGVAELWFFCQTPYVRNVGMLGTLTSTLVKDKYYYFEMFVCLSQSRNMGTIAIDAICIAFTENDKFRLKDTIREVQICSPKEKIISDSVNWTKISGYFKATGNEKYIVIGGFKPRKEVNYKMINPYTNKKIIKKHYKTESYNHASYYIDDLLLVPVKDSIPLDFERRE